MTPYFPRVVRIHPLEAKKIFIPHNYNLFHWRLFVIDLAGEVSAESRTV